MAVLPSGVTQELERRRLLVLRSSQAALVAQVLVHEEVAVVARDSELDQVLTELTNLALRIGQLAEARGWLDEIEEAGAAAEASP
jgi:hypothetical protein